MKYQNSANSVLTDITTLKISAPDHNLV